MMLLEHDAKSLFGSSQINIPAGWFAERADDAPVVPGPWIVKAQVPIGGRGKAGGIIKANDPSQLRDALTRLLGTTIRGHRVQGCRVEQMVAFIHEVYFACMVDPQTAKVRVLMSAHGGMDVEDAESRAHMLSDVSDPHPDALGACADALIAKLPSEYQEPLRRAASGLIPAFFTWDATLLEINPLFVTADGNWVAGDAKLLIDDNALPRHQDILDILTKRAANYPEMTLKLKQGFDFVELDPDGDMGLVTTGAGLSMQLVDELIQRGARPINFCDIRTGQFKGDPARLIYVLRWLAAMPSLKSVLINFFAGNTDLGEVSQLLLRALQEVPELKAPITARLIGNGLEAALRHIAAAGSPIVVETDLDRAMDLAIGKMPRPK